MRCRNAGGRGPDASSRPRWTVGLLSAAAIGDLTRVEVDFLAVDSGLATRRFIDAAQQVGETVHVLTINDPLRMLRVIGKGADGIITDEPALAREVLAQREKMGAAERLLISLAVRVGAGAGRMDPSSAVQ